MTRSPDWSETPWRPWHTCLQGTAHRRDLRNCQDATAIREGTRLRPRSPVGDGRFVVGAVSDGVGSHRHAEIGARLTATIAVNIVTDALHRGRGPASIGEALTTGLPARLGQLADLCRDEWTECCYATIVVAVGTVDWFAAWACGDGYLSVNGETPRVTGVLMRDRLPVDYRHTPGFDSEGRPRKAMLEKLVELPAREVASAWIGTDGARYLTADGAPWKDHLGDPLADAPPVAAGWKSMEQWGERHFSALQAGMSSLRDDLGLVAFVPRDLR